MRTLITAAVLSALSVGALTFAVMVASTAIEADTALLSTVSAAAVVVGLVAILVTLLERSHQRVTGPRDGLLGGDRHLDRDGIRVRDELRAIGSAGVPRT